METKTRETGTDPKLKRTKVTFYFEDYIQDLMAKGYEFSAVQRVKPNAMQGVEIKTIEGRTRHDEIDAEMTEATKAMGTIDGNATDNPMRGDEVIFGGWDDNDEKFYIVATVSASPHDTASDDVDDKLNANPLGTDGGTMGTAHAGHIAPVDKGAYGTPIAG